MLKFIHITKTGGTSVEDYYLKEGIRYGRFDHEYCQNSFRDPKNPRLEPWHSKIPENSYLWDRYSFFTIIRNPKDRLISEYYHCASTRPNYPESIAEFNSKIFKQLSLVHSGRIKLGHWAPQINHLTLRHLEKIHLLDFRSFQRLVPKLHKQPKQSINIHSNPSKRPNDVLKYTYEDLDERNKKIYNNVYLLDKQLYSMCKQNDDIFQTTFMI